MEPEPIAGIIGKEAWIPPPPRKPSGLTPTSEQRGHARPMVIPSAMPETIIAQVLKCSLKDIYENADYKAYVKHVLNCKKRQTNWDEYRNDIDQPLQEKWGEILKRVWKQGFLFGFVKPVNGQSRIIWAQRVGYAQPEESK
jgi:hypothetical protein